MKKKFWISLLGIGGAWLLFETLSFYKTDTVSDEAVLSEFNNDYRIHAIPVPDSIEFAGETMPIQVPDVRERLDREILVNVYWQSNTLMLIKRANKYFPVIEPILKEKGIPDDFKYLAVAESGLMHVVSPAGAAGMWQLMRSSARELGLEVNDNVDERYNLELSTRAACDYLLRAYEKFGSWTVTAASYNAGINGIASRLEKQGTKNYYDLLLPDETSRYVFRVVALKEILSHPEKYGFYLRPKDLYTHIPTRKVEIDVEIRDLYRWAKEQGINYKILKIHNPWLRQEFLVNRSRKKYRIAFPASENIYRIEDQQIASSSGK